MPNLSHRHRVAEVMDDPALPAPRHWAALRGLMRINRVSDSVGRLWRALAPIVPEANGRALRVLDVACGAGDVAVGLWHRAQRAGTPVAVDGCDLSPRAVVHATEHARARDADVRFFTHDALAHALPAGYDVVMCSLFLHHLEQDHALRLLRSMREAARRMVLVSDLRRSRVGYWVAMAATRLLTRSDVVHIDGPRSVRAAFTMHEALQLAHAAGLEQAQVRRCWPWRWLMQWRRP